MNRTELLGLTIVGGSEDYQTLWGWSPKDSGTSTNCIDQKNSILNPNVENKKTEQKKTKRRKPRLHVNNVAHGVVIEGAVAVDLSLDAVISPKTPVSHSAAGVQVEVPIYVQFGRNPLQQILCHYKQNNKKIKTSEERARDKLANRSRTLIRVNPGSFRPKCDRKDTRKQQAASQQ